MDWVFRVATSMDGYTAQLRRAYGLNAHERLAVAALWATGPMTMTELGSWIPLSRAAVTTLVDRLEALGLVQRGSDPSDRRRTVVRVVERAIDAWRPVYEPWAEQIEVIANEFDDTEWATINRFLQRFREVTDADSQRLRQMSDAQLKSLVATRQAANNGGGAA